MLSFFQSYIIDILVIVLYCILIFIPLLLGVVFALYADRKIWAAVQKEEDQML